jgi:hypothetical protein
MTSVDIALAVRAVAQGFQAGADPMRRRRRVVIDPATHQHWRRGFEAGRTAAAAAEKNYDDELAASERK